MNTPEKSPVTPNTPEAIALNAYLKVCAGMFTEVIFNTKKSAEIYTAVVAKYRKETTIEEHEKNVYGVSQSKGIVNGSNEKVMLALGE